MRTLHDFSWVTATWSAAIAACVTLAFQHLWVWVKDRAARAHLLVAVATISSAGLGVCELLLMRAESPERYALVLRWALVPVTGVVLGLVGFVRVYLHAGRPWLAWTVAGLRLFGSLVVNFLSPVGAVYTAITDLRPVRLFGETVSTAVGIENPWNRINQLSTVFMLAFFVDAAVTTWRRGDRRRAVIVAGSISFYGLLGMIHPALIHAGKLRSPYFLTFGFLGITAAMSYVLAEDVLRARSLARQLQVREAEVRSRLEFETLLSELSSRFINLPARELDREIEEALRHVCEMLDIDLAALWQWSVAAPDVITATHVYATKGLQAPLELREEQFPWYRRKMLDGRVVAIASLEEFPAEAAVDRENCRLIGVKSNLTLPLSMGGEPPVGALGFNTLVEERGWPDALVNRLQLVAQIFTHALSRKRYEVALEEGEERLAAAADSAGAGLWALDLRTRVFWASKKARALFGYSSEEVISIERFEATVHPDDRDAVRLALEGSARTGEPVSVEYRIQAGDGRVRWISSHGRPRSGAGGEPDRLTGASIDITERKAAEAEALLQRDELAHLSRVTMLGELSGSLAHELNQPLTAILSNAQAAQRHLANPVPDLAEVGEILGDIVSEDKRAGEVIRRLRLLLRKGEVSHQALNISEVVGEVMKITHSDLVSRSVAATVDAEAQLPAVAGDRVQLQQVLLNLVVNACDAMADDGFSADRRLAVRVSRDEAGGVRVSVTDRGHGIPADRLGRLFEPFFTTKTHGIGLGLAVCRTIVEAHGGTIWAENNAEPPGATFHLRIPAAAEPA